MLKTLGALVSASYNLVLSDQGLGREYKSIISPLHVHPHGSLSFMHQNEEVWLKCFQFCQVPNHYKQLSLIRWLSANIMFTIFISFTFQLSLWLTLLVITRESLGKCMEIIPFTEKSPVKYSHTQYGSS